MMGIAIDGPAYIFGDNKSVLYNTTIPGSTLKKKLQSITYRLVINGVRYMWIRMTIPGNFDEDASYEWELTWIF